MWKIQIFAVATVLVSTTYNQVSGLDETKIYEEIKRKLRSTPDMNDVYNVGPAPKTKYGKDTSRPMIVESICPSVQEWKNLSRALTASGDEVTVIQNMFEWAYQWFYTVQCSPKAENRSCQWIDEKQAPRTVCRTKYNLVPAIVQIEDTDKNGQSISTFDWRMIRIPGQCGCYRIRPAVLSGQAPGPYATKLSALE